MLFGIIQKRFFYQRFASCAWIVFVLFLSLTSKAERLPVKTYTVADGLLRDYVYKIRQDSRGFLWFCTPGGVSRFDGYGFTGFTVADGLPDRGVNDFLESKNGTIWLATNAGLARLNPTGIRGSTHNPKSKIQNRAESLFSIYLPENPKAKRITVLLENESGQIFVGTSFGLYRLTEKNGDFGFEMLDLRLTPSTNIFEISSIIKDRRGALWVGTHLNGLFRLSPDGRVEQFAMANGLPGVSIESLLEDKNGRIWVGMRAGLGMGLCLLVAEPEKDQKIVERIFTTKDGLPADWIMALYEARDGQFWVATTRGLCRWQGEGGNSVCKIYTAKNDICDTDIWALTEDKDGNLWTGSRCGAKKLARYGFTTYTEQDGIENPFINSIFENAAGELFVSFDTGTTRNISRFNGKNFDLVKPNFPPEITWSGWGSKQTVWQDRRAGDWWFPTGHGLYRFARAARLEDLSKSAPQRFAPVAGLIEFFRLFEDSRGDFWCATTGAKNGLWRWEREAGVWHDYARELDFIDKDRLGWAFIEDAAGNIWISTGGNESAPTLIRYRDGTFKIFGEPDGLPAGLMLDLFVDSQKRLWIANSSSGLLRLENVDDEQPHFTRYSSAEGLSTAGALCVTEDEFGRIYVCTARGLDRLSPESGQIENFTTADGLPSSLPEFAYRDRTGALWFGANDGLARFQPEPERLRQPPNILITGLRVGGIEQNVSILGESLIPALALDSDERQVSVDFVGLGAALGEKLRYEYRLNEAAEWTATVERTINFANLSPGDYQFEVRAVTADRIYSRNPAALGFKIAAPLWQRPWFIALALALSGGLIYLFYKNRLTRLLEMERMRTRIATDLHDDIGANLTRISLLTEVVKQKSDNGSGNLLSSIADIARESVASMNDIVWAISPEHDSLLDLTRRMRQHAEEVFTLREIDLKFDAPPAESGLKLSVGVRRDLLLIFKEAVNNAAKHSDCSRVEINFDCRNSILNLQIEDDGKGFEVDPEGEGQGLRSMTRRARALGGNLTIDSRNGTTVKFELPLSAGGG